ncbi:hypothetical protein STENM223S_00587 [Streptomyces tendae]
MSEYSTRGGTAPGTSRHSLALRVARNASLLRTAEGQGVSAEPLTPYTELLERRPAEGHGQQGTIGAVELLDLRHGKGGGGSSLEVAGDGDPSVRETRLSRFRGRCDGAVRGIRCSHVDFMRERCPAMAETRDVVELILRDHRKMEDLFRLMRSVEADRAAALREFADLLIAHAEAEEAKVYPALKRYKNIDDDEVEHGEHEHEEGNEALLALLEVEEVGSEEWD